MGKFNYYVLSTILCIFTLNVTSVCPLTPYSDLTNVFMLPNGTSNVFSSLDVIDYKCTCQGLKCQIKGTVNEYVTSDSNQIFSFVCPGKKVVVTTIPFKSYEVRYSTNYPACDQSSIPSYNPLTTSNECRDDYSMFDFYIERPCLGIHLARGPRVGFTGNLTSIRSCTNTMFSYLKSTNKLQFSSYGDSCVKTQAYKSVPQKFRTVYYNHNAGVFRFLKPSPSLMLPYTVKSQLALNRKLCTANCDQYFENPLSYFSVLDDDEYTSLPGSSTSVGFLAFSGELLDKIDKDFDVIEPQKCSFHAISCLEEDKAVYYVCTISTHKCNDNVKLTSGILVIDTVSIGFYVRGNNKVNVFMPAVISQVKKARIDMYNMQSIDVSVTWDSDVEYVAVPNLLPALPTNGTLTYVPKAVTQILSTGAVIGIGVGLAFIVISSIVICCVCCKKKIKKSLTSSIKAAELKLKAMKSSK